MNKIFTLPEDELRGGIYRRILLLMGKNRAAWQSVVAAIGLFGGLLSIVLGVLVWAVVALIAPTGALGSFLDVAGTALFVLPLPLLALGAHCLDLLEKKAPALPLPAESQSDAPHPVLRSHRTGRRSRHTLNLTLVSFGVLLPFILPAAARAQQTLFNVPSADVLDEGKIYFELDTSLRPFEPRFSSFVPRVVIGVGGRTEVGLNVTGNIQPGADQTTLVPTVKWKAYDGSANGWAFVVGDNLFIPVRNKVYNAGNYAYAGFSKTFRTKTRVTAGGYHFTEHVVAPDAQRAGGQFGFEQTLTKKLNFQADWYTGKHALGYFTPGVSFKLNRKLTGYAAYSLGNAGLRRGNHFVYAELGVNFN